jgi:3-dehydroquinate dehydratase / shikimate dehydrogenase
LNRSAGPAQKLARSAHARTIKRPDLKKYTFDVIINATPVGMGNTKDSPLTEKEMNTRYLFEMIYDPPETRLVQIAKARGVEVIPGLEMFVHQAARQFEIWTGKPAPWDEMLRVVNLAVSERAAARNISKKDKERVKM